MKLHLTATSERGKSVEKTANTFISTEFTFDRVLSYKVLVDSHNFLYLTDIKGNRKVFMLDNGKLTDITDMGKPKTARECEHYGCGNFAENGSDYCIAH